MRGWRRTACALVGLVCQLELLSEVLNALGTRGSLGGAQPRLLRERRCRVTLRGLSRLHTPCCLQLRRGERDLSALISGLLERAELPLTRVRRLGATQSHHLGGGELLPQRAHLGRVRRCGGIELGAQVRPLPLGCGLLKREAYGVDRAAVRRLLDPPLDTLKLTLRLPLALTRQRARATHRLALGREARRLPIEARALLLALRHGLRGERLRRAQLLLQLAHLATRHRLPPSPLLLECPESRLGVLTRECAARAARAARAAADRDGEGAVLEARDRVRRPAVGELRADGGGGQRAPRAVASREGRPVALQHEQARRARAEGLLPLQGGDGIRLERHHPAQAAIHLRRRRLQLADRPRDRLAVSGRGGGRRPLARRGGAPLLRELGL